MTGASEVVFVAVGIVGVIVKGCGVECGRANNLIVVRMVVVGGFLIGG